MFLVKRCYSLLIYRRLITPFSIERMLVVCLRGLILYCAPPVPSPLPLFIRQSLGVFGEWLSTPCGPHKGRFAKAGYNLS